nr:MAG: hypothetical protein [Bacteriophage sp.]
MADVSEAASKRASKRASKSGSKRASEGGSEMDSELKSKTESKAPSDIYSSSSSSSLFLLPDSSEVTYSGEEVARAAQIVAKACHWVRRNPDKWSSLKAICHRLALEGELVQRGSIYERARQYGLDVRLCSQFRRDHNLWSVLTRFMAMERPSMLSAISFRVTPVDAVDLAAYWRDIVGPDEFVASSLEEAREIWDVQRGAR